MGLLEHIGHGRSVNGGDHEDFCALGDHVFDLGQLVLDIVICKLQIGIVAQRLEGFDHALAVRNPAGGGLGRHGNTNQRFFIGRGSSSTTTGRQNETGHHHNSQQLVKQLL